MSWLKERKKRKRGGELIHQVPEMQQYVKDNYKPKPRPKPAPQSEDKPKIRYSLPDSFVYDREKILDMKRFTEEAKRDLGLFDTPAMQNTYHTWEKKNAARTSFSAEVIQQVNRKFKKPSEFYRPAGIDKRTWSQMKSDFEYQPSRKTALRCCIGLQLTGEESEKLLKLAGYAFSPSSPSDLVVRFCLEHGIWDLPGVNYMLEAQELKGLDE